MRTYHRAGEQSMVGLRPYFCTECPLSFPTPEELGSHIVQHDPTISIPPFVDPLKKLADQTDREAARDAVRKSETGRQCRPWPQVCPVPGCTRQLLGGAGWSSHLRWHDRTQFAPKKPRRTRAQWKRERLEAKRAEIDRQLAELGKATG